LTAIDYRREIDGLRALAVIPVILFHAGFSAFGGGFVGVDVFFVISGYLITSIILSEKQSGKFTLINFYERRARRILPALFVVLLACIPAAWLLLLPRDMQNFSQTMAAVSAFASNILFWRTSGYFETAAELKPLLHTWSLAVEEQYYLLFPLFVILAWPLGKRWIMLILANGIVGSLALAQWASAAKPAFDFFMLPTRGWEILLGALVAFHFDNQRQAESLSSHKTVAGLGSAAGLLLVCTAVAVFDKNTPFPSLYALVPTVGTALLILFATPQTLVGKLLGNRVFVGVGLISYSAYLWHQPLLAFARHASIDEPSTLVLLALCAAAFALAYVSWRFVETPFRNKQRIGRRRIFLLGAVGSLAFAGFGLAGHFSNGFVSRKAFFTDLSAIRTVEQTPCHNAQRRSSQQIAAGDICTMGKGREPSFAVIGDSHAGALFDALGEYPFATPTSFWAFSGGWCAPLLNGFDPRASAGNASDCRETTAAAFARILATDTIKTVVLDAEWANYTQGYRNDGGIAPAADPKLYADNDGPAKSIADDSVIFTRSLLATIGQLKAAGKTVYIVGPVPEFKKPVLPAVSKAMLLTDMTGGMWNARKAAPQIAVADYDRRNAEAFSAFDALTGVGFIPVKDLFCDQDTCFSADPAGKILFSDSNHVTYDGAKLIAARIAAKLAPPQ
jgi:peptidoglycan/LPS O-acetylase OafA/YrhL